MVTFLTNEKCDRRNDPNKPKTNEAVRLRLCMKPINLKLSFEINIVHDASISNTYLMDIPVELKKPGLSSAEHSFLYFLIDFIFFPFHIRKEKKNGRRTVYFMLYGLMLLIFNMTTKTLLYMFSCIFLSRSDIHKHSVCR